MKQPKIKRCPWSEPELMRDYHDREWGVPVHDDRKIFEFLVLEGAQAGLSWATILKRREEYRKAFSGFDFEKVSGYGPKKRAELMENPGIIRNRLKIESAIKNARAFIKVRNEFGSFDEYIWRFVGGRTIRNRFRTLREIPASTKESEEMSRDMRKRGFSFVGPTIMYAHMQATGMVNDHVVSCFRHREVQK